MRFLLVLLLMTAMMLSGCSKSERLRGLPPGAEVRPSEEEIAEAEREADELGRLLPPPKGVIIPMLASQDGGQ